MLNFYFCCCSSRKVPAGVDHVLLKCYVLAKRCAHLRDHHSCLYWPCLVSLTDSHRHMFSWNAPCILMSCHTWMKTNPAEFLSLRVSARWPAAYWSKYQRLVCGLGGHMHSLSLLSGNKRGVARSPIRLPEKKPTCICFMSHQIKCSAQHILVFSTFGCILSWT